MEPLLQVEGLSKRYCRRPDRALAYSCLDGLREIRGLDGGQHLRPGEFWALRDLSLELYPGEVLGVIGANGAGKSTLISLIAGLIRPTLGRIHHRARRLALMDYQGGLHGLETGLENIRMQLLLHGFSQTQIKAEIEATVQFAGLGDFIYSPVATYSQGMRLRLAFAIYTRLKPDLFLVDEAITAGDIEFRHRFQSFIRQYVQSGGSLLFCSHELFLVQILCQRCAWIERGRLKMLAATGDVISAYQDSLRSELRGPVQERRTEPISPEMPVITSFKISGLEGQEIQPGRGVVFELEINSPVSFPSVLWGIEIGQGDIFPLVSMLGGLGSKPYQIQPGLNRFGCRVDRLTLAPGQYEVKTGVSDRESGATLAWIGYQDSPELMEVSSVQDQHSNFIVYRKSLVVMESTWL